MLAVMFRNDDIDRRGKYPHLKSRGIFKPVGADPSRGIAVELNGNVGRGFDRHAPNRAMYDTRLFEVNSAENEPKVTEHAERPRVAKHDKVESAVVVERGRGDGEPERIPW